MTEKQELHSRQDYKDDDLLVAKGRKMPPKSLNLVRQHEDQDYEVEEGNDYKEGDPKGNDKKGKFRFGKKLSIFTYP